MKNSFYPMTSDALPSRRPFPETELKWEPIAALLWQEIIRHIPMALRLKAIGMFLDLRMILPENRYPLFRIMRSQGF